MRHPEPTMDLALHVNAGARVRVVSAHLAVEVPHTSSGEDSFAEEHRVVVARTAVGVVLPVREVNEQHQGPNDASKLTVRSADELLVGARSLFEGAVIKADQVLASAP